MTWLAVLVALAVGVAIPSPAGQKGGGYGRELVVTHHKAEPHHHKKKKPKIKAKVKPRATATPVAGGGGVGSGGATPGGGGITVTPGATATPTATPRATPTATTSPTPAPTSSPLPTRTGVDFNDRDETGYTLVASHPTLAHGSIEFVGNNNGMDDHNLTIKQGGHDLGSVFLPAGESDSLVVTLAPGTYTLYCSLANHEQLGMREDITVQ